MNRQFEAPHRSAPWVDDVTDVATWAGFVHTAVVIDADARRDGRRPVRDRAIDRCGPRRSLEAVDFATLESVDRFGTRRQLEPIGDVPSAEAEARRSSSRAGKRPIFPSRRFAEPRLDRTDRTEQFRTHERAAEDAQSTRSDFWINHSQGVRGGRVHYKKSITAIFIEVSTQFPQMDSWQASA